MIKITIGIAHHKSGKFYNSYPYLPIQVGSVNSEVDLGIQRDDVGNNISIYNPYYSELTATYWLWKNINNVDYVGLFHYRRFLSFKSGSILKRLPKFILYYISKIASMIIVDARCFLPEFSIINIDEQDVEKELNDFSIKLHNDIIKNNIDCYSLGYIKHSTRSVRTHLNLGIGGKHFELLEQIIKTDFSDFYPYFKSSLKKNKFFAYNMIIAKKDIYDDYCSTLFNILEIYKENLLDKNTKTINKALLRDFGYIGEVITSVYIDKIISEGKSHKKLNCTFVDVSVSGLSYNPDSIINRIKEML